ncbi:pyridoxine 5'-phosphate synthase [Blattabacterium punctulatus]|uniref:pyridoxine 5'-phosphate synthase n=1 Tax=Blattabacterium punctulatus TaxID=164514 RepID=UPI000D7D16E2|nr:pyridoxine 5'-phosphate synthase [Blattabacterium punctulatus]AWU42412.1 pyridoxine 5'-phosphate synthase [Blattabacterium punctulatus]AWU42954.1 pyridoxine 5'-phosphate synthase [Blattabacterium punctulatus]AWU44605.1 pyridoxine 5'-phosphate synthase [Blattabacterium punctulatus]AWU45691.1 pyridoxine 5'-phosphate synthase [Blattabacterium punctulatus]
MVKLSVNLNKIATLRNSRGGNIPNVLQVAIDIQKFGANGITIHPRPDERHISYKDVYDIKSIITTELNIEGNPINKFMKLVLDILPNQVTLVPDLENVITSNSGWNTILYQDLLTEKINKLKDHGIRTSIFLDPNPKLVPYAANTGADRIELYTENFSIGYANKKWNCIHPYIITAKEAMNYHLLVNAGHDLNLENISFLIEKIPNIEEVSIGHSLISDSLYMGLENTIQTYLKKIYKSCKKKSII